MGLYNRAIQTQSTPGQSGGHEGVLKKALRSNSDTRRYASTGLTYPGRREAAEDKPTDEPTVPLTPGDIEKKKN